MRLEQDGEIKQCNNDKKCSLLLLKTSRKKEDSMY